MSKLRVLLQLIDRTLDALARRHGLDQNAELRSALNDCEPPALQGVELPHALRAAHPAGFKFDGCHLVRFGVQARPFLPRSSLLQTRWLDVKALTKNQTALTNQRNQNSPLARTGASFQGFDSLISTFNKIHTGGNFLRVRYRAV